MACEYENEKGHCTLSECMYGDFLFRDDSAFGTGYPLCMAVEEDLKNRRAQQMSNGWIPCSIKKPKPETRVLVTVKGNTNWSYVSVAMYEDGNKNTESSAYSWDDISFDKKDWEYLDDKDAFVIPESWWEEIGDDCLGEIDRIDFEVVAWMPLPEPYKEES